MPTGSASKPFGRLIPDGKGGFFHQWVNSRRRVFGRTGLPWQDGIQFLGRGCSLEKLRNSRSFDDVGAEILCQGAAASICLSHREQPLAQQLETRSPIALSFDKLKSIDLPLSLSIAPDQREARPNRWQIPLQGQHEALDLLNAALERVLHPLISFLFSCALSDHFEKALREGDDLPKLRLTLAELSQRLRLP